MISPTRLRKASVALIIGTFALSACGGPSATSAPASAGATSVPPTTAATTPPATSPPVITLPPSTPEPTGAAEVDPAEDLEIAAPYTFEPLDEQIAAIFVTAMEQSLGALADVFQVGVRSAVKGGQSQAFVIVMAFPDLPIGGKALLDGAAQGAIGSGGTVETRTIGGVSVRVVEAQGQAIVLAMINNELVMVIGQSKKVSIDVSTAIIEAN